MFTNLLSKRFGNNSNSVKPPPQTQTEPKSPANFFSNGGRLDSKNSDESPAPTTTSSTKETATAEPPPPVTNTSAARANFFSALATENQNKPNRNYVDVFQDDEEEEEEDDNDVHRRRYSVELIPLKKQQLETTEQQCNKVNSSRNSNSSNSSSSDNNSKNKNSLPSQSISILVFKEAEDCNSKQF